jgi:hypothetical protein
MHFTYSFHVGNTIYVSSSSISIQVTGNPRDVPATVKHSLRETGTFMPSAHASHERHNV